jgi:hypothetical protein
MANGQTDVFRNPLTPGAFEADRLIEMKTRGNPSGPEAITPQPQAGYMDATALSDPKALDTKKLANRRSPYMG